MYTAGHNGGETLAHLLLVTAFIKVGHQYQYGVLRSRDHTLTVSQGPGYIGSSAELDTEQQVNRILQVIGKVNDRRVEHNHSRTHGRQGGQYRTEDAGIDDGGSHRTALVETENDVLQSLAFSAVAYPDFRNDGLVLRLVVLQVF